MKIFNFLITSLFSLSILIISFVSKSAIAASINGVASAIVASAISINSASNLTSGTFVPSENAGYVIIDASGASDIVNNVSQLAFGTRGVLNIAGQADAAYIVTVPTSITLSNGNDMMTIDNFSYKSSTANSTSSASLSGGGTDILYLGAKLTVASNQASGTYSGSYNVTVVY